MTDKLDTQKQANVSDKAVCGSELNDKALEAAGMELHRLMMQNSKGEFTKAELKEATGIIIKAYEAAKWQPMHDKTTCLPENIFFLVATTDKNVLHSKEFGTLPAKEAWELLNKCTHWQPLPKPPKGDE